MKAYAAIREIAYILPEHRLTNEELASLYPEWPAAKIEEKLGIVERHVARDAECASDLAFAAAQQLFGSGACDPRHIDFVLLCTQSPDYLLPTTACLLQHRLNIPTTAGALDINLGCSGYVYGLGLAKGLIETKQARAVLLITAETYSKFIHPGDKSVRTLFGDGAAATLICSIDSTEDMIGPFVYGTDGAGAGNLIVPTGGMRASVVPDAEVVEDESGNYRTVNNLYMNGPEIFNFTLRVVPKAIEQVLCESGKNIDDIDLFVFHQANKYMLDYLRRKLALPAEKFVVAMTHCGNTVSSSIPIALAITKQQGKLLPGMTLMLVGFGVGYSWGATIVKWNQYAS